MKLLIDIPNCDLEFLQGDEPGTMVIRLAQKLELIPIPTSLGQKIADGRHKKHHRVKTTKAVSTKTVPQPAADPKLNKIVMDDEGWQ